MADRAAKNQLWPLPSHFPVPSLCVQLQLPDDPYYIAQFNEMLRQAAAWPNYDRDTAHNATRAAAVWKQVIKTLELCPPPTPPPPCHCDDCNCEECNMDFQQVGCLLQVQCNGQWITIYDPAKCPPTNPAPGNNPPTVPPGQSGSICIECDAGAQTPIPFVLNAGDTLNFTTISGAGTDGNPGWYCVDGQIYFAGICAGGGFLHSGDPASTVNHMALLLKIGSTYYPLVGGSFTIPSGVINGTAYIMPNSSNLALDRGKYNVCLTYTNNNITPPVANEQTLDFTQSNYGFKADFYTDSPSARYVPGFGWANWLSHDSGGDHYHSFVYKATAHNSHITRVRVYVQNNSGASQNGTVLWIGTAAGNSSIYAGNNSSNPAGLTVFDTGTISLTTVVGNVINLYIPGNGGAPDASYAFAKLVIDYSDNAPY